MSSRLRHRHGRSVHFGGEVLDENAASEDLVAEQVG